MANPFKIIDSRMASRQEFLLVDGCQPTHALFYLKEGNFVVEIDGAKEEIRAGDCVILPDYVHFRRSVLNPIVFVYIKFAFSADSPLLMDLPCGRIDFKDRPRFLSSIGALERLLDSDEPRAVLYREHLLNDILFQVCFEQNPAGELSENRRYSDEMVASAAAYIAENIGGKIAVEDVCRAVGTNASTLNFRFRRQTSMPVGRFIMSERMKRARHLLRGTTYSLADIAGRCGFENGYYFSTAFRKFHGISPSDYRKDK